jgi:hypothetical protein
VEEREFFGCGRGMLADSAQLIMTRTGVQSDAARKSRIERGTGTKGLGLTRKRIQSAEMAVETSEAPVLHGVPYAISPHLSSQRLPVTRACVIASKSRSTDSLEKLKNEDGQPLR